jgi:hypothetical protein
VWLAGPRPDDPFREVGLRGADIRRLVLEHRGLRRFLWAPAFAVGDDPGTGCHRSELRGTTEVDLDWTHLGQGWDGGICHEVALLADQVLAASQFNGVLCTHRDGREPWSRPSFDASGLPLLDAPTRRFLPVVTVAAAGALALCGTERGPFRTTDGAAFSPAARRTYVDVVTVPSSWLLTSGRHQVMVIAED